jgi:hypothetical protein
MDVDTLSEYYSDLLVFQYRGKDKARATIKLLAESLLANGVYSDVQDGFGLTSAIGVQLDTVGKYIGVGRNIGVPNSPNYFSIKDDTGGASDTGIGLRDDTNGATNSVGVWRSYTEASALATEVNEYTYSLVIRLKALTNVWDGTHYGAQLVLKNFLSAVSLTASGAVDDATPWTDSNGHTQTTRYLITGDIGIDVQVLMPYFPRKMGTKIKAIYTKPGVSPASYQYP